MQCNYAMHMFGFTAKATYEEMSPMALAAEFMKEIKSRRIVLFK